MKFNKFVFLIILVLTVVSCDSFLDIDPKQEINTSDAISSGDNIDLILKAAYPDARIAYGDYLVHCNELLGSDGDIDFKGTFQDPRELFNKSMTSSNGYGEFGWAYAYRAINSCNLVIAHIDKVDDSNKNRVEGQALFLRGLLYFDLARSFAKPYIPGQTNDQLAVPLVLTPTTDLQGITYPSRATLESVYTQVISDLTSAKTKLKGLSTGVYANEYAAAAILSRVFLQKEMFEQAAIEADYVIKSDKYDLASTPFAAYNLSENGKEDIFAFQQNLNDNLGSANNGISTFYASTDVTGRSDYAITEKMLNRFEAGDLRGVVQNDVTKADEINCMYYKGFAQTAKGNTFCAKWIDYRTNVTFIRLAEMYLTRAEGNFESGKTIGATPLADINVIRERAGLSALTTVSREQIRNERFLELTFEGFKLQDLKRWQQSIGTLSYDSPKLIMPIPKREIDVNKNLTQNEGY